MSERNDALGLSTFQVTEGDVFGRIIMPGGKPRVTHGVEVLDPDGVEFDFPVCYVKLKRENEDIPIPEYAKDGDAGFDLAAKEGGIVEPGQTKLIGTGLFMAVPKGFMLSVVPRSGIALKTSFWVRNSPGTVDSGYRDEIRIIAYNSGTKPYVYAKGDRLAQGIILPVYHANFIPVDELDDTERGTGGFGSTGVASK
jgi:dUTP pyrophosphatase